LLYSLLALHHAANAKTANVLVTQKRFVKMTSTANLNTRMPSLFLKLLAALASNKVKTKFNAPLGEGHFFYS